MSKLRVGVIGANGFIGKHLTEQLLKQPDVEVKLFGRSDTSLHYGDLPYTTFNVTAINAASDVFSGLNIVYYLASETIPASSWNDPLSEIEKNLKPFIQFCELAVKNGVSKVVFVSSAGTVYGESEEKLSENASTTPFSPYGIIKLTMENFLSYFNKKFGLNYDIYRVSNVYGAGQDTGKGLGIINTFLERIISDQKITIFGDGKSVRNYVYVTDVAKMLCHSVSKEIQTSGIYNIASKDTLSINDLVTVIKSVVTESFEVIYVETRKSDNPAIDIDNSKIISELRSFSPTPLSSGILQTYSFLKNRKN